MRSISRDVISPTHFCFMLSRVDEVVVFVATLLERSTTIMPFNLRSMQTVIASRTVASLDITGSTHRSVCLRFRTSDILTSDIRCRGSSCSLPSLLVELELDDSATRADRGTGVTGEDCLSEESSTCATDEN